MSKRNTTIRTLFGGIGPVSALFLLLSNFASRECAGGTINWVGSSGDWNSASNWSGGAVPGASDDVVIDTSNGSITVTMSSGSNAINSLNCQETLQLNGGILAVSTTAQVSGELNLDGGTIQGGTMSIADGASLVIGSSGALVGGVTVNGLLDVGNSVSGANLAVYGGLTLNGTMLVGNANQSYGGVNFEGSQLLGGNGTVVFGDSGYDALGLGSANTTLVIGPAITVHGQYGEIGAMSSYPWYGPQNVAVVNQGTISSDGGSGYVITVTGTNFNNAGALEAQNGATLNIQDMAGNLGQVSLGANSTLGLNGNYTNNLDLTVGTNATLNLSGNWSNPGTINAPGGALNFSGNWINGGQIQINGATASLGGGWVNTGQIDATGGSLTLGASWTTNVNNGIIQSQSGTLDLEGTFTLAMFKFLEVGSGETMNIVGQLDNTNTTLVIDGALGSWVLAGGSIAGGSVLTTNNGALVIGSSGALVGGVTVNGVLDVGNSVSGANLAVYGGLTLNGTMLVGNANQSYGGVNFEGSQLLGGNGTVVFGDSGYDALGLGSANTTLVIGPAITVHGQYGEIGAMSSYPWYGPQNVAVVNQGTISSDGGSGYVITVTGTNFNNAGALEAQNGATLNIQDMAGNLGQVSLGANSTLGLNGNYTNNLDLTVGTNATLNLSGNWSNPGTINAPGGALNFSGNWINGGQIQINGATASLGGGWVNTGQIDATGGSLTLGASWTTNVNNGIIQSQSGTLDLEGTFTLAMFKFLEVGSGETMNIVGQLDNTNTTLVIDGALGSWVLAGGSIAGGSVLTTNNGALVIGSSGALVGGVTVNGVLDVGNSVSGANLAVYGGLTLNGTMLVGNANQSYGGVNFEGSQLLGGNGTVVFGDSGYDALGLGSANTTLVIGPAITVHGQYGEIGAMSSYPWYGPQNVAVVNQGTISSDGGSGYVITVTGTNFNNAGALEAQNGATLNIQDMAGNLGQVSLGANSTLGLNGNYTNNLDLTVGTNATLNLSGNWSNPGTINAPGGALNFSGNWINGGQIQINGATASLGGGWVNTGQIDATGGSLTLGASWTTNVNNGIIQSQSGTLDLEGTFTLAMFKFLEVGSGETMNIVGQLDNTNTTLVIDGALGSWVLAGGSIAGGSVLTTNNGALVIGSSGALVGGVTVNGLLDVGNSVSGANLAVYGGLTLNGTMLVGNANQSYGGVNFEGSQLLGGNGTVVFGDSGYDALWLASANTTLVIGPAITVHGQYGEIGAMSGYPWYGPQNVAVVNQGTIAADVASGAISITGQSFNNTGMLEAQNGGAVQVSSTATTNTGTIDVETGTITFPNIFTQTSGTLAFGLNSATDFGQMAFTGLATLGGTLAAHINGYFEAQIGDSFPVLNYGGSSPSITNFNLPTASYVWTNTATNGLLTIAVTGILPTSVSVSPTNSVVPVGSTVTFQAIATGPGPLSIQWRLDGANLPGATNTSLMLTNVSKSESGTYTVQVSNTGASLISGPAQLLVLAPPAILVSPQSQTATIGTAATFAGTVSGDSPLSYQWVFNGASLAGATNPALTLSDVTRAEGGSYVLLVANPVGMATSAPPAVLTVASSVVCPSAPGGMVAWWRGDGDTSDYAGTNDAVFEGPAAYAPGEVGEAFSFNGFSSYMAAPDSPLWNFGTNDFSIELWANFNAVHPSIAAGDESVTFVAHDDPTGTDNKWIFGFGGGELYLYINDAQLGPQFLAQAAVNLNSNQWHHLGLTKGMGVYHIYVDGAAVSSTMNNVAIPAVSAPLTIGQADDFLMDGLLDEISIYKRALAPAEMQAIYLNGSQGKCGSSQSVTVGQPGFNSNRQFQFQILGGVIGQTIYVQASSNLANWVTIWQVVKTQNLEIFTDTNSTSNGSQFYRSSLNP